jgi:hypothetical protein
VGRRELDALGAGVNGNVFSLASSDAGGASRSTPGECSRAPVARRRAMSLGGRLGLVTLGGRVSDTVQARELTMAAACAVRGGEFAVRRATASSRSGAAGETHGDEALPL